MANGYKINRSNYTLRTRHQTVKGGTVYERDWMATTNLGGWDSGSIPYSENNFRMVRNRIVAGERKSRGGLWLQAPSGEEFWTFGDITPRSEGERENNAKTNITYHSLLDFAYFGSCTELVTSTIRKIINDFPGEIYVTGAKEFKISGASYYAVQNPFEIDLISKATSYEKDNKVLDGNYSKYQVNGVQLTASDVEADRKEINCQNNVGYGLINQDALWAEVKIKGTVLKYVYFGDGPKWFCSTDSFVMSPTQEALDEFFDNVDDFSRLLLNRNTKPKYTALLDTPRETDEGFKTSRFRYTWPTTREGSDVIDVVSEAYGRYVAGLLDIAKFYDEYYTDNLWRMLTHDSVKNLDTTFIDEREGNDEDDYYLGATNMQGLLWAYGRQFDELKREIDGIKRMARVTYDGDGCMPNDLLNKRLELSGWETYDVRNGLDESKEFAYPDTGTYTEIPKVYDVNEAAISFMRNLQLNSRAIFSKKGTKYGIESLLGMFGLISYDSVKNYRGTYPQLRKYDYKLDEYVVTVTGNAEEPVGLDEQLQVEYYNTKKANYDYTRPPENTVEGLPVAIVETENSRYVIPWFSKDADYDGGIYFQMYGGWSREPEKDVLLTGTVMKKLTNQWSETIKYLHTVPTIGDLPRIASDLLRDGMIVYVVNIDDASDYGIDPSTASNYFYLPLARDYETVNGDGEGWRNILHEEIFGDNVTDLGLKVIYLESIVEDFAGNNPHVGYGNYDDGEAFLDYFRKVFKATLDEDAKTGNGFTDDFYDCETGYISDSGVTEYGFPVERVRDNMKVWFFKGPTVSCCSGESEHQIGANVTETTFESDLEAFDFETGESGVTTEAAANSIINVKNIRLEFFTEYEVFKDFLIKSILPYLKQVVPSTTIMEIIVTIVGEGVIITNGEAFYDVMTYVDAVASDTGVNDSGDSNNDDIIEGYRVHEGSDDNFYLR